MRDMERQLLDHVGPNVTLPIKLQIEDIVRMCVQRQMLEERVASGNFTDLDRRTLHGLYGAIRRAMNALPGKSTPIKPSRRRVAGAPLTLTSLFSEPSS